MTRGCDVFSWSPDRGAEFWVLGVESPPNRCALHIELGCAWASNRQRIDAQRAGELIPWGAAHRKPDPAIRSGSPASSRGIRQGLPQRTTATPYRLDRPQPRRFDDYVGQRRSTERPPSRERAPNRVASAALIVNDSGSQRHPTCARPQSAAERSRKTLLALCAAQARHVSVSAPANRHTTTSPASIPSE
jgi:hypothetical protein